MRTLSTIFSQRLTSRGTFSRILILTAFIFCCISSANAEKVETVLYENSRIATNGSEISLIYDIDQSFIHYDNLTLSTILKPSQNGKNIVDIYLEIAYYNNNNKIIGEWTTIDSRENIDIKNSDYNWIFSYNSVDTSTNFNYYKLRIRASGNKNYEFNNLKITANTALPENLELDYSGEKSVTVKWDTELPDQRQRFRVALENNEGINLTDIITTDYSATLELTTMRPQGYNVVVYSLGDGINNANTIGKSETKLHTYTTSLFCLPSESAKVRIAGSGKFNINLLNSSGKVVQTEERSLILNNPIDIQFNRDSNPETETLLDNEYRVQVAAAEATSYLTMDPERESGDLIYKNEEYLAQLVSDIKGQFNDKFELIETLIEEGEGGAATASARSTIYQKEIVEFELSNKTKQIDLITSQLATEGGYQAVIRFQAMRSNSGHTPKLEFFVADMANNRIITDITASTIIVNNNSYLDKTVSLTIPSTVNIAHKIIIRCTVVENPSSSVTCFVKDLRISRHDNIATNVQLSSCSNNLNISWDIANTDSSIEQCYVAQILDETGSFFIAKSTETSSNSTSISLEAITSGIYKIRILTLSKDGNHTKGISAMRNFTYIKAGDIFDTGSTTNIDYLMLELEDNGNIGALNKVAQMTTTNTALSVNKVALQLKITSGQYYFVSFPFQPDQVLVNCDEATHRSNILLRSFNSEGYSNNPNSFSISYPVMGDATGTMPFNEIDRGKGYLLSVNSSVTSGTKAEVFVTIIGNVSSQDSRYINYNLQELDVQGASVIDTESGGGYGFKGWSLLSNPFPRTFELENNFYVSVYKLPSQSSLGNNNDGKVAAAGYSVYRSTPGDSIPSFVPFFVQSDAATFAMKPRVISSSAASAISQELRLSLSDGSSFDEVILNLDQEASQFYTIGKDLIKMSSLGAGVPQISSRIGDENLVVRALTNEMAEEGIPVELFIGKSGKQSLSIASSEWNGEYEYIVRNENGEEFALNNGVYEFDGVAGQTAKVTFIARTMPLSVEYAITQKVVVSQTGDAIEISSPETIENIKLFNINGMLVKSENPMSEKISIKSIASGAYVVEINMASSREVVKVVIQ
ncbi:MAG: T9SS type A sorting domain-containing protein [Bacteroidales bacterium]